MDDSTAEYGEICPDVHVNDESNVNEKIIAIEDTFLNDFTNAKSDDKAVSKCLSLKKVEEEVESQLLALPGVLSVGIERDMDTCSYIRVAVENESALVGESLPDNIKGYTVKACIRDSFG